MLVSSTCCVRLVRLCPLISFGAPTAAPGLPRDEEGRVFELYEVGDTSFSLLPRDPRLSVPHLSPAGSLSEGSMGSSKSIDKNS